MVMGGDSCSKGCEFESWHRILDGHFFTYVFVVKLVMCLKRRTINSLHFRFMKFTTTGEQDIAFVCNHKIRLSWLSERRLPSSSKI